MSLLKKIGIFVASVFAVVVTTVADTAQNPRAASVNPDVKSDSKVLSRTATVGTPARRAVGETRVRADTSPRTLLRAPAGMRVSIDSENAGNASVARSGTMRTTNPRGVARSATNNVADMSRAATTARATAVFNDLSKIGSGYAACRESYATCMDQMCANANDTYRRCFCSDKFIKFRDVEESLDEAMIMLQQFQDNNLEVIDKTAAEVNAMYSATIGEAAIKRDTSASAKLLDKITKLLSGGGTSSTASNMNNSIGILDLDFSVDFDDVWSDGGFSLFDTGNQDLSTLEGTALFNAAQRQCTRLTQNQCENNAVFTMSCSSYNILISQDCNTYEKALNKKKETVAQAVRTAEKYLREARLEEYRAHNSMDVNECLARVRTAMLADTACGENYKRCLDPTGRYINPATGEPIDDYRPWFFQLDKQIELGDLGSDILKDNDKFNKFLDGYRSYVSQQLDTCRSIADFVWTEFKRNAIIEIAQAQANKIEEVKSSCVDTIAECYDDVSQSIVNLGSKRTATTAGALGRYTARGMCQERVTACAALYSRGGPDCTFDKQGHLTSDAGACGLKALITYVDTVDDLMVIEKCKAAVDEYLADLCTPDNSDYEYPYNCRSMGEDEIRIAVTKFVRDYCTDPTTNENILDRGSQMSTYVNSVVQDVQDDIQSELVDICESLNGVWESADNDENCGSDTVLSQFYNRVGAVANHNGCCYQNSERNVCLSYGTIYASWDTTNQTCSFTEQWYRGRCNGLDGYYDGSHCYVPTAEEG